MAVTHHLLSDLRLLPIICRVTVKWETATACLFRLKHENGFKRDYKYAPAILNSSDLSLGCHCHCSQTSDTNPSSNCKFAHHCGTLTCGLLRWSPGEHNNLCCMVGMTSLSLLWSLISLFIELIFSMTRTCRLFFVFSSFRLSFLISFFNYPYCTTRLYIYKSTSEFASKVRYPNGVSNAVVFTYIKQWNGWFNIKLAAVWDWFPFVSALLPFVSS